MLESPRSLERGDGLPRVSEALHDITLDLFASDDAGEIAGKALSAAGSLVVVATSSIWVPRGDELECRGAIGEAGEAVSGRRVKAASADTPLPGEEGQAVLNSGIAADGSLAAVLRLSRSLATDGPFSDDERELIQRLTGAAGAAIAAIGRLEAAKETAAAAGRDLATITAMSREITATLDLDRVLRSVVNLATRMLTFDRGAIALYEHGACDIRAMSGVETIDPKNPQIQDLAVRAAWAAGRGEHFYVSDRDDPASDEERVFVQIFGEDMARDNAESGLYLPLKDEEGIVGILLFESSRTEFATPHQRELAEILANQATVAVRNAQLYRHVPMADTLGALVARKEKLFEIPRRKRALVIGVAVAAIAALTLIRWPLRVDGAGPVFRPLWRADVRPTISGVVDRVFVREGMAVARGAPIAHLRDDELRAQRDAASAEVSAADRAAAMAASRGDAAEERLQRLRVDVLRRDVSLLDEQINAAVVRSPVSGVVLTHAGDHRSAGRATARPPAGDPPPAAGRADLAGTGEPVRVPAGSAAGRARRGVRRAVHPVRG